MNIPPNGPIRAVDPGDGPNRAQKPGSEPQVETKTKHTNSVQDVLELSSQPAVEKSPKSEPEPDSDQEGGEANPGFDFVM